MKTDDKKKKPDPQGGEGEKKDISQPGNFELPTGTYDEEIHLKEHEYGDGSGYETRADRDGK